MVLELPSEAGVVSGAAATESIVVGEATTGAAADAELRAGFEAVAEADGDEALGVALALADAPERYTPWFRMEWQALRAEHAAQLAGYIEPRGAR